MNQPRTVVLDTNIVLDVFVFADAAAQPVRDGLAAKSLDWIATAAMRDELARVLGYPQIVPRLVYYALDADAVLERFDHHARLLPEAPRALNLRCPDPEDQRFIDLAVQHRALLLSKDRHILSMRKRLASQAVSAQSAIE